MFIQNKPYVSVVIPAYNCAGMIAETLHTVLEQDYPSIEIIVINDGSTDATLSVLASFGDKINVINQLNSGSAVARSKGIHEAKGKYIAFIDSDDVWFPHKLETQLKFMHKTGAKLIYSAYQTIDENSNKTGARGVPEKLTYRDMLKTNYIGCLTVIYDTEYFGKVFMPLILKRQDFGLWLKLLKQVDYAYGMDDFLGGYRVHASSISANKMSFKNTFSF